MKPKIITIVGKTDSPPFSDWAYEIGKTAAEKGYVVKSDEDNVTVDVSSSLRGAKDGGAATRIIVSHFKPTRLCPEATKTIVKNCTRTLITELLNTDTLVIFPVG